MTQATYTTNGIDLFFNTSNSHLRNLTKVVNKFVSDQGNVKVISANYDLDRGAVTLMWEPKSVSAQTLLNGLEAYRGLGESLSRIIKGVEYTGSEFYLDNTNNTDQLVSDITTILA